MRITVEQRLKRSTGRLAALEANIDEDENKIIALKEKLRLMREHNKALEEISKGR